MSREGCSSKKPAPKDWMPKDEELLYRAHRWAHIFRKYDVFEDYENCNTTLGSLSDEEEYSFDDDASDESISDSSFENRNYKSDSDSHYEKVRNETLKIVKKREATWKKSGIDKLMDSMSIETYGPKVYKWLRENDVYFQPNKNKYQYGCNSNFADLPTSDDSDDSVNTARYILSNRKRQMTRVQTMTIKQYTFSKNRLIDKLKPKTINDISNHVFSNTEVKGYISKRHHIEQVQSEAGYKWRNFSRSRKCNTNSSLPDNFRRRSVEKHERLAPKRRFHYSPVTSSDSRSNSSSLSSDCHYRRRSKNDQKKARRSSRFPSRFSDRPTRKNKRKESKVSDNFNLLQDPIYLLNTRKYSNSFRCGTLKRNRPLKNYEKDSRRTSPILNTSDSDSFSDHKELSCKNKGKENQVIDNSLQDSIDLLFARRKDNEKYLRKEKNQTSISASKSVHNLDNERRRNQRDMTKDSSRNEQNRSLYSDNGMQSFESARSFNSNDVLNSTTLSTGIKQMRIRKENPMTTINEVPMSSDSESGICRKIHKDTKNSKVSQSKQGTPASPILIYSSDENFNRVAGQCRDDGKLVITQNDIEKSSLSLGKPLNSKFFNNNKKFDIVDSNAKVSMCLPEKVNTSIPIDPIDLVGKRRQFKIVHPTCDN